MFATIDLLQVGFARSKENCSISEGTAVSALDQVSKHQLELFELPTTPVIGLDIVLNWIKCVPLDDTNSTSSILLRCVNAVVVQFDAHSHNCGVPFALEV